MSSARCSGGDCGSTVERGLGGCWSHLRSASLTARDCGRGGARRTGCARGGISRAGSFGLRDGCRCHVAGCGCPTRCIRGGSIRRNTRSIGAVRAACYSRCGIGRLNGARGGGTGGIVGIANWNDRCRLPSDIAHGRLRCSGRRGVARRSHTGRRLRSSRGNRCLRRLPAGGGCR